MQVPSCIIETTDSYEKYAMNWNISRNFKDGGYKNGHYVEVDSCCTTEERQGGQACGANLSGCRVGCASNNSFPILCN